MRLDTTLKLLLGVAVTLLALDAATATWGSDWARPRIEAALRRDCPRCRLTIGKLRIHLLAGTARATEVHFASSPEGKTRLVAKARQVELAAFPWQVAWGVSRHVRALRLDGLDVEVIEDSRAPSSRDSSPMPANGAWLRSFPPGVVDGVWVSRARFTYRHLQPPEWGDSELRLDEVSMQLQKFGTRPELSPRYLEAEARARLERSGQAKVVLALDLFRPINEDRVRIELRDEDLDTLNRFFHPEARVALAGWLDSGEAELRLRDGELDGELRARYQGVGLKLEASPSRGALKSLLANLGERLSVSPTGEGLVPVRMRRDPGQSVFKWMIAGLKESAQSLLQGKGAVPPPQAAGRTRDH